LILQVPIIYLVGANLPLPWLIPTQGPLLLMLGATQTLRVWQWGYAIVVSLSSMVLAFWWTKIRFAKFIGLKEG
jgi:hypothetical protein